MLNLNSNFVNKFAVSLQRNQLSICEKIAECRNAVIHCPKVAWIIWQTCFRLPLRRRRKCYFLLFCCRGHECANAVAFCNDSYKALLHSSVTTHLLNIVWRDCCSGHQAPKMCPAALFCTLFRFGPFCFCTPSANFIGDCFRGAIYNRLDPRFLAFLGTQQKTGGDRYIYIRKRRVRAWHSACPDPGDHRRLPAALLA